MDSFEFFENKEFNGKFKEKSGVYIIENPIFTRYVGYPIYKVGYARDSLYTRISNYRTAYGLVPFKIHILYCIPMKVTTPKKPVNYSYVIERVLQETARKYGEYAGIGEWFKNLSFLLSILLTVREKHLKEIPKAKDWEFYSFQKLQPSINKITLVDEFELSGSFKGLLAGRQTRSGDNIDETADSEEYELVALGSKKNEVTKQRKTFNIPTTYIDENGRKVKF